MRKILLSATVMVAFLLLTSAVHLVAASGPTGTWKGPYNMNSRSSIEGTAFCGTQTSGIMAICLTDGVGEISYSTTSGTNTLNNAPYDCLAPMITSSMFYMGEATATGAGGSLTKFADYTQFTGSASGGTMGGTFGGTFTSDNVIVLNTGTKVGTVSNVINGDFSLQKTSDNGCGMFIVPNPTPVPIIEETNGLTGITNNDNILIKSTTGGRKLISEAATALNTAAQEFKDATGKKLYLTSISRTWDEQVYYYEKYEACMQAGRDDCVQACDPGGDIPCPHMVNVAVDAWCEGASNRVADPQCQSELTSIMAKHGFCRLSTEGWHFEFNSMHTSPGCSMYTDASYLKKDPVTGKLDSTPTDPTVGGKCREWDYHSSVSRCTLYDVPPLGTASVTSKSGDVNVKHLGSAVAPLASGTVPIGDTVQTGNGIAELGFGDYATVGAFPSTTVTIVDIDAQLSLLLLKAGKLKAQILNPNKLPGTRFSIKTPNVVLADRGTEYVVSYLDGKTTIYLHEGELSVYFLMDEGDEEGWAMNLTAGHSIVVDADGAVDISEMAEQKWLGQMSGFGTSPVPAEPSSGCAIADDCPKNGSCTIAQCMAGSCAYYSIGCELSGSCAQSGEQRTVDGLLSYCDKDAWKVALGTGLECTHDSQCVSYTCTDGRCVEEGPLGGIASVFGDIWKAILGLFGLR